MKHSGASGIKPWILAAVIGFVGLVDVGGIVSAGGGGYSNWPSEGRYN